MRLVTKGASPAEATEFDEKVSRIRQLSPDVVEILKILKEAEAGAKIADLCRKYGFSEQTYYRWKSKYGGMDINEARRLKQLEEENRRLKKAVADLTLDVQILKEINSRKW
ncbi:MAG TPA: transposase [Myxococcota bacterium]|nr:transposase [Myxococcota bacterium]